MGGRYAGLCPLVGENHRFEAEEDLPRPRQAVFRFRTAKEFDKAEQSQTVSFGEVTK